MIRPVIKSFSSINRLYRRGVNICKGCERENYASCAICELNGFSICNKQAAKVAVQIFTAEPAKGKYKKKPSTLEGGQESETGERE